MTDQLRDAIRRIRDLTPELNAVTDKANAIVARVEKFLNDECSVGIPAYVRVGPSSESDDGAIEVQTWLAYARVDGKFRIAVQTTVNGEPEENKPWPACQREVKLEVLDYLPKLLTKIADEVSEVIAKTDNTAGVVEEILESMTEVGVPMHVITQPTQ